jgi:hypothetical protein
MTLEGDEIRGTTAPNIHLEQQPTVQESRKRMV